MKFGCNFGTLFALIFLLSPCNAIAVEPAIWFERISTSDGLPQATVYTIHQDNLGFMWFGTADGLARYDGYRFKIYHHQRNSQNSLPGSLIRALAGDSEGQLWIGTNRGISKFDPKTESFVNYLSGIFVWSIYFQASNNALWVGTDNGLYRFNQDNLNFVKEQVIAEGVLVSKIISDQKNNLWIGTVQKGLFQLGEDNQIKRHYLQELSALNNEAAVSVLALHFDERGYLWIGTEKYGLKRLELEFNDIRHFDAEDIGQHKMDPLVSAIDSDGNGNLWVGTFSSLHLFDRNRQKFTAYQHEPENSRSIGKGRVNKIYTDRGGQVWIGTWADGVSKFSPDRVFKTWDKNVIYDDSAITVMRGPNSSVWVGTFNGVVKLDPIEATIDRIYHQQDNLNSLSHNYVRDLHHFNGDIWIATHDGLNRYNSENKTVQRFYHNPEDSNSLSHSITRALASKNPSELLIGTQAGLNIYSLDDDSFKLVKDSNYPKLHQSLVSSITFDQDENLWLGTHDGLYILKNNQVKHHFNFNEKSQHSISSDVVTSIFIDSKSRVWVATNGGLNRFTKHGSEYRIKIFGRSDGFISDAISAIAEDDAGILWLSNFQGISRFDPESLQIRNFVVADGTLPDYTTNAVAKSNKGTIYFAGLGGVTYFEPSEISDDMLTPSVVISEFRTDNELVVVKPDKKSALLRQSIAYTKQIELPYTVKEFSFEIAALHYSEPDKNLYAYKLEGFHSNWNYTDASKRWLNFSGLRPGDYRLVAKASNKDGVWSPDKTLLNLIVLPPWWLTWWAISLMSFISGATLFVLYRLRVYRLTSQKNSLKKEVALRILEIKRKNQELQVAYEAMKQLSMTDQLTGLKNRHFLVDYLDDDIAKSSRAYEDWLNKKVESRPKDSDLIFFNMDLDHFKHINDTYGHSVGDRVLVQFKEILCYVFRNSDYLVRWGGEEFLVVARFCERNTASEMAERLRLKVSQKLFDIGEGRTTQMSCSIGFACYPFFVKEPDAVHWTKVIDITDQCLYIAKDAGRNAWIGVEPSKQTRAIELGLKTDVRELLSAEKLTLHASNNSAWIER